MTKVQCKSGCDHYLLSYEHFYLPNLPTKMGLKKCFLPQQMECRWGPTVTVTSLKVTWIESPHQDIMVKTGKNGCIRAKLVVLGQRLLYSGKNVCNQSKWLYSSKSSCIRARWLYSGKSGCIWAKVVEFGTK